MTLNEIEIAIAQHFNPRVNLIVPNVYWGMGLRHECDLLVLRKTGYCAEVEIKRSRYARRLTDKERYDMARLGCLRIWGLKRKLVKK